MIRQESLDDLTVHGDWLCEPAPVLLATGMIAGRGGLSCTEAFDHLHDYAIVIGRPLVDVAGDVMTGSLVLP